MPPPMPTVNHSTHPTHDLRPPPIPEVNWKSKKKSNNEKTVQYIDRNLVGIGYAVICYGVG